MKQKNIFIFLLFCIILPCLLSAQKQRAIVAITNQNTLYIGFENRVEVTVPSIPDDKLIVKTEDGIISGSKGIYIIKPNPDSRVLKLEISYRGQNNKIILADSFFFRVKQTHDPTAFFGTKQSGRISRAELKLQSILSAQQYKFIISGISFQVESFTFNIISKNFNFKEQVSGNALTASIKNKISEVREGDLILIEDIIVKGTDGSERKIDPVMLLVE